MTLPISCAMTASEWHAGYPLNAFAMLMIRVTDSGDAIDIGLLH